VSDTAAERLVRALVSLEGLSVGDAFGERFFVAPNLAPMLVGQRALPAAPWAYTDDTQMALSIVEILSRHGVLDHERLTRSYGPAMHRWMLFVRSGKHWSWAARTLFGGQGSFGNGSAMRVAPLGAYFADDLDAVVEHARRSAEVTHAHSEATVGAIAVAVAAAEAGHPREAATLPDARDFIECVLDHVPESAVRTGIERARDLPADVDVQAAATALGNGSRISCQDTVPFTLWCAAQHLDNYRERARKPPASAGG
jgi:ADP-ribosylglycohydrolase